MRITLIAALATAALGASPALAASAPTETTSTMPAAQSQHAEPPAAYAQFRGRYYRGGPRYVGRGYGYYGRPYAGRYYRRGYGGAAAAGIAGLATGAIIGGALAAQAQPAPTYVVPGDGGDAYCAQRYRSYDPASGTFLGHDGLRHPCP
jgi:hypothetical protein